MSQTEPGTHGRDVAVAPPQWAWAELERTRKAGRKGRLQLPPPLWGTRDTHKPPEQKVQGGQEGLHDGPVRKRDPSFPS